MRKYIVTMNGTNFVEYDTEKMARDYVDMQRRSMQGAGLAKSPSDVPDVKKSFAAKQTWDIKIVD